MIIYHHNDDDGRCAAAIVNLELTDAYDSELTSENFIEYSYDETIKHPDWDSYSDDELKNEIVYILDISLNDIIYELIKDCLNHNCRVVYIDHHKTSLDFMRNHPVFPNSNLFTPFYGIGVSACLLAWVYACMNSDDRKHPLRVDFDFSETYSHVMIHGVEYRIPMAIRYIDDNDVWRHSMNETRMFREGFKMEKDKSPHNIRLWSDLIYKDITCTKYVDNGQIIDKYNKVTDKEVVDHMAFEYDLDGITILCLNYYRGNSDVFGDKFHEYPAVIKYAQVAPDKWTYSIYSTEHPVDGVEPVDVSLIAERYGGGGHAHASGFSLPFNLFTEKKGGCLRTAINLFD